MDSLVKEKTRNRTQETVLEKKRGRIGRLIPGLLMVFLHNVGV